MANGRCGGAHFLDGGSTSTVSGGAGSATRTFAGLPPGARRNGTWASPRSTTLYVPGGTLPATVSFTVASDRSGGTSVVATPKPGGGFRPLSCTLPRKSGQ